MCCAHFSDLSTLKEFRPLGDVVFETQVSAGETQQELIPEKLLVSLVINSNITPAIY